MIALEFFIAMAFHRIFLLIFHDVLELFEWIRTIYNIVIKSYR